MRPARLSPLLLVSLLLLPAASAAQDEQAPPNIIVILSDDMGYSDIGAFGGEIRTPSLDKLAESGLKFTQFYNTARCCPTRASLLTGLYPHQAGMGHMTANPRDLPGYPGNLHKHTPTIADVLQPAGYRTYMVGKWHVNQNEGRYRGDKSNWPMQRGFEKYYGIVGGASNFFDNRVGWKSALTRGNRPATVGKDPEYEPDVFYMTDAFTDHALRFLDEHAEASADQPFFMYVAYTAAHWPMHALPEDIARYEGVYDAGYEPIRKARLERMKALGLLPDDATLSDAQGHWPEDPEYQAWEANNMAVYAAMVDRMDQGIGRIVDSLREKGMLDNTLILYLQDNGGCAENYGRGGPDNGGWGRDGQHFPAKDDLVMAGPVESNHGYGKGWANVSNTPYREYKHWVHEGGINTPLIAHWPEGIKSPGEMRSQPGHLIDIMATVIDVSGTVFPSEMAGRETIEPEGISLVPLFEADVEIDRDPIFWEHEGNRALRDGRWKLVAKGPRGKWELYDIEADRTEQRNVIEQHPEVAERMIALWFAEAERTLALPWPWADGQPPAREN